MTDKILSIIEETFPLKEQSAGEFATMKANSMTFHIQHFVAEGLGKVSFMDAKGMMGLMKMQTIIINPFLVDAPMLSYDRIFAMGNDTLFIEPFNTMLGDNFDKSELVSLHEKVKDLPDRDPGEQWYEYLRLKDATILKKGKKNMTLAFDQTAEEYVKAFMQACKKAEPCDEKAKKEKASAYSEGLLSHGGPSTDVFKKDVGEEKTQQLFRTILFGC